MATFAYIGDEAETDAFGLRFPRGDHVEVNDEHAIRKLRGNAQFSEVVEGVEVLPKRRGRPPKAK